MLAAREGDVELARILVGAGADVNAAAGDGKTALALAIFNGNYDVGLVPRRQQGRRQQGRRAALHAALLGGRSAQHGNGAELPVDGHRGSDAAHPQAARRRRRPERARQQHAPRAHARGLAAHRLRHGADARGVRRRSRAGEAAARARRRSRRSSRETARRWCRRRPAWRSSTAITAGSRRRSGCRSSSCSSSWATTSTSRTTTASRR